MEEGNVIIRSGEHFVKWGADKFAAADDSDFLMSNIDIVSRKKPENSGGSGGIIIPFVGEAVDIFFGCD